MSEDLSDSRERRLSAIRKNAQRRILPNWFLAASLAVTGAGFLDIFTLTPRFSRIEGGGLVVIGIFFLFASWRLLSYLEDEDIDHD